MPRDNPNLQLPTVKDCITLKETKRNKKKVNGETIDNRMIAIVDKKES
jgi:hypothetical protein